MAAYAALTSLLQILDELERHPCPPISLDREQLDSLTEIATFLQKFLEGYDSPFVDSDEADPLEMRIAYAAYAAEDIIESYIVDNIQSSAAATHNSNLYEDVRKVIEEMDLVEKEAMERTAVQDHHQLQRNILRSSSFNIQSSTAAIHNDEVISSGGSAAAHILTRIWSCFFNCFQGYSPSEETNVQAHHQLQRNISSCGKNSSVMVGFDDVLLQLLHKLTGEPSSGLQVIPITGMGGIGKTTLARNIFQHAYVKEHFDICAWVTISQQYNTKEILSQILYQASGKLSEKSEEELGDELHKYLFGRRYLIIMDDMWNIDVWEKIKNCFPDCGNGSRVVVTTRQSYLTSQLTDSNGGLDMEFLDEDNSWKLFSKTVFGEEGFPPQLEKIGKKIVEKCRGLPLSIVVIGGLLAKSQHTQKYWEHIEQNFNSTVKLENDEFCLKILKLSYHHLPAYLKPSFLYMGIFKEDTRIHVSTLIKLWVSEGFIKPENGKSLELIGEGFVKDLIDRNLILVDELGKTGNIKFCKMHDLLRDLCMKEAENERFYHVIGQHSRRDIQNHKRPRMVSDRSTSEERVMSSLESTRFHVRSLIFRSKYVRDEQSYDVIVNSHYGAIINFSENSTKFLSSVNFFWNLHILRINGGKELMVAPVEIWKMSQLRHVEFKWRGNMYLPDPPSGSSIVILENLQTLTGILNFKCGEEMVKRIPNIKKLGIEYRRHDELEEIPLEIGEIPTLKSIELRYCSESAVKSAKKIVEEQEELQGGEEHLSFLVQVEVDRPKQEALQSLESRNFQIKLRIGDRLPLIIPVGAAASSIAFEAILQKVMMMVEKLWIAGLGSSRNGAGGSFCRNKQKFSTLQLEQLLQLLAFQHAPTHFFNGAIFSFGHTVLLWCVSDY